MIDRDHDLPLAGQVAALELSRSSIYSKPCPMPASDLTIMRRIDEVQTTRATSFIAHPLDHN